MASFPVEGILFLAGNNSVLYICDLCPIIYKLDIIWESLGQSVHFLTRSLLRVSNTIRLHCFKNHVGCSGRFLFIEMRG